MKKYIKFIAFVVMLACLMSMNIISAFAAVGSSYNTVTYTLGGYRGYMESNYAYNVNTNSIMRAESKNVDRNTYSGKLDMYFYSTVSGRGSSYASVNKTHGGENSNTIVGTITYSNVTILNSGSTLWGDIEHNIGGYYSNFRGVWSNLTEGWDFVFERP